MTATTHHVKRAARHGRAVELIGSTRCSACSCNVGRKLRSMPSARDPHAARGARELSGQTDGQLPPRAHIEDGADVSTAFVRIVFAHPPRQQLVPLFWLVCDRRFRRSAGIRHIAIVVLEHRGGCGRRPDEPRAARRAASFALAVLERRLREACNTDTRRVRVDRGSVMSDGPSVVGSRAPTGDRARSPKKQLKSRMTAMPRGRWSRGRAIPRVRTDPVVPPYTIPAGEAEAAAMCSDSRLKS